MTAPMTDAEIREALARAERATCSCHIEITRVHGFPQGHRSDCARTDVPRLAADLLAARAERDLALSLRNTATNVLADVVAHRDSLAARCRELEGFVRGFLHASSGTRNENAAALLSRFETRAQVLLSPPPSHTCQIHRATSGASDCGLSPCEEATVHTDRGAARPATVRRVRPAPGQEARCGSRTKLRGSDGRPLCERHGGVRADFQQNDEPCIRVQPTPSPEATETWRDAIGCAPSPPGSISSEEAVRRVRDGEATPFEADTMTHEEAPCATCGGRGTVCAVPDGYHHGCANPAHAKPCPDCHGCGGAK